MDLLDNPLIRKYFSPNCGCITSSNQNEDCMGKFAYNVLQSMQEPIKKADRYLEVGYDSGITSEERFCTNDPCQHWPFHPNQLRLPDRFQKQEETSKKCGCGLMWGTIHRFDGPCYVLGPTPDPEKCEHYDFNKGDHCTICSPGFVMSKPKDEVEERIKELLKNGRRQGAPIYDVTYHEVDFERNLRELVELSRKSWHQKNFNRKSRAL